LHFPQTGLPRSRGISTRERSFRNALRKRERERKRKRGRKPGNREMREIGGKTGALNSASNKIPPNAFVNNAFSDSRKSLSNVRFASAYSGCHRRHWNHHENGMKRGAGIAEMIRRLQAMKQTTWSTANKSNPPLCCFLFSFSLSFSLSFSITLVLFLKAKRDYAPDVGRRSQVIHFQRNTTTLFDGTIFHVRSPPCTILRLHFLTIALPGRLLNKAHRFVRARSLSCSLILPICLSNYLPISRNNACNIGRMSFAQRFISAENLCEKVISKHNLISEWQCTLIRIDRNS